MHPILFEIPLPERPLSLLWVFGAVAALLGIYAVYSFVRQNKSAAAIAGILAGTAAAFGFATQGDTWEMGPVPIYSYGVMLGLSLVVGWYLTLGLAERDGLPKEIMANCYVVTAIAAIAGSRILYVLTNLGEFETFGSIFAMRSGGLVAYGGFLGGLIGSYAYLRMHKLPLLPWADVAVPSLASGLMITRIGCYLFGCDFGKPLQEDAPEWLKKIGSFPHWTPGTLENGDGAPAWVQHVRDRGLPQTATHSLPVHPTQIYESLVGLALLVLLLTSRRYQKFRGQIFLIFAFAYGYARFMLELLRDDQERGTVPPTMSVHILFPLALAIMGVAFAGGFAKMITNIKVRRVLQVAMFIPPILVYVAMRPESFAGSIRDQLSTSQAIGLASAVASAIAFSIFYKAAERNPVAAMALNLPPQLLRQDDDEEDDEEEEEDDAAKKRAAKRKKTATKKTATKKTATKKTATTTTKASSKERDAADEEEDGDEEDGDGDDDDERPSERKDGGDDDEKDQGEKDQDERAVRVEDEDEESEPEPKPKRKAAKKGPRRGKAGKR